MDIPFRGFRVKEDGAITVRSGLKQFPEQGIWAADDRLLAFFSQEGGGLSRLVFQGKQPQSANAFLLNHPAGALALGMRVENGTRAFRLKHKFGKMLIRPYGWENSYPARGVEVRSRLCVEGSGLLWQVQVRNNLPEPVRVAPELSLNRESLVTQVNGRRMWREPETAEGEIHLTARDQLQTRTWIDVPGFKDIFIDAETHILIGGETTEDAVCGLSISLQPEEIAPGAWGQSRNFFVACSADPAAAAECLADMRASPNAPFARQSARYAARAATRPALYVRGVRSAGAVYRLAPVYAEACKVRGTGALRSSAGGHYFVWGWDNQMGGHELTHWGDVQAAKELLDFIATHPSEEGAVPHRFDNDLQPLQVTGFDFVSQLFISLLYQVYGDTLDEGVLHRGFPFARTIFRNLASQTDEDGLYHGLGMYPDAPEKLGRDANSLVAYENGFWYCACRMMEALARRAGDPDTAAQAARLAAKIEQAFLNKFFDPDAGFLVDALVSPELRPNGSYPRYSLFPLHNPFGAWLLRPARAQISQFIQHELVRPDGMRMVPEWDAHTYTETVTSDCWFLHFDLYCLKAFRRAGDGAAVETWLRLMDRFFRTRQVIPELQMLAGLGEDAQHWRGITGQIWQLFAMSGWTRGLLEGVMGIESDLGGLTYIPCPLERTMRLENFPYRGGLWTITVKGTGSWLQRMTVDGEPVGGTCKLPEELYTPGAHDLVITRGTRPSDAPLLLEAVGASVSAPRHNGQALHFELRAQGQVNVVFTSPTTPRVLVDGQVCASEWDLCSQTGTFSLYIDPRAQVSVEGT